MPTGEIHYSTIVCTHSHCTTRGAPPDIFSHQGAPLEVHFSTRRLRDLIHLINREHHLTYLITTGLRLAHLITRGLHLTHLITRGAPRDTLSLQDAPRQSHYQHRTYSALIGLSMITSNLFSGSQGLNNVHVFGSFSMSSCTLSCVLRSNCGNSLASLSLAKFCGN